MRSLLALGLVTLLPALASAQEEKVDLEIKVISLSTKEGKFEPELKKLLEGMPLSFKSGETIDGHTKPAVGKGEGVRFQVKGTKEWVLVEVRAIGPTGIEFKVQLGEKAAVMRAKATKRGATAIAGPLSKTSTDTELFVVITPR